MKEFVPPASKADIIDRAISILHEHGHTKGIYQKDGKLCLMGAIYKAAYGHPSPFVMSRDNLNSIHDDITSIRSIMKSDPALPVFSSSLDQIVAYNDAEGTGLEDVVGLLTRTKERLG